MLKISFTGIDGETVEETPFHDRERKYPYLATDEHELLCVLFTAPDTGVVLCSAAVDAGMVGDYHTDMPEDEFYPIEGQLLMVQTESQQ
jgi:hypothetical protein